MRLRDYDYAQAGGGISSRLVKERGCLFGDVVDGEMRLKECGEIVTKCEGAIPAHFPCVELDEFVVMPDYVH